jgi:DNA-directed RNA polymerase subunit alpha
MEDVTDIVLNIKNLIVQLEGDEPKTMRLAAQGPGEVTADMIEADTAITILNKDLVIATLTADRLRDGAPRRQGPRLRPRERAVRRPSRRAGDRPDPRRRDLLPRAARPLQGRETRVGQKTNYDKLTLEIWTNGTVTPEMALVEAAKILRKHLNPFVQYFELGEETVSEEAAAAAGVDEDLIRKLNMPIERARALGPRQQLPGVGPHRHRPSSSS